MFRNLVLSFILFCGFAGFSSANNFIPNNFVSYSSIAVESSDIIEIKGQLDRIESQNKPMSYMKMFAISTGAGVVTILGVFLCAFVNNKFFCKD